MKTKKKLKRIVLGFPSGITFVARVMKGVLEYAREQGGWSFVQIPERLDPSLGWLSGVESDGALIIITNEEAARTARALPMPVVNLTAYLEVPDLPTVMVDQEETARMAARHLIERKFSRYGYYGTSDMWYSQLRRASFVETIEASGGECRVLEVPSALHCPEKWTWRQADLEKWLRTLSPPVGIMASTDLRACMVADACARLGLRIPQDVALVGVDNDPVSEFHDPPLSSVSRNDSQVGLQAAALLDRLMRGESAPTGPILIPPDQVVCRQSTRSFGIEVSAIARSLDYIQKNLHRPFGVEELVEVAAMSRRSFEQHFLKSMGMTAYAFINQQRVEHARQLLADPQERSLTEIARLSGFSDLRRFRLVFRRLMGETPALYRRQGPAHRQSSAAAHSALTGQTGSKPPSPGSGRRRTDRRTLVP
jgi:LacI family transcriptional regulator